MCLINVETEDYFADRDGEISGIARMDVETEEFFDADLGGSDGPEVTHCELVWLQIGGLKLTREALVDAFSDAMVSAFEEKVAGEHLASGYEVAA